MIEAEARAATRWELSPEGTEVLRDGSPEVRLFRSLPPEGLPQSDAMVSTGGNREGGGTGEHRVPDGRPVPAEAARRIGGFQQGHGQQVAAPGEGGARRSPRLPRRECPGEGIPRIREGPGAGGVPGVGGGE